MEGLRRCIGCAWVLILGHVLSGPASIGWCEPGAVPPELLEDAELWDVFFLDSERGWAVGDRGVIWRTVDGGQHWRLQDSHVGCTLRCIHFSDQNHGWIVGGWTHPYSHRSTGVVLHTQDGGDHWRRIPGLAIPNLQKAKFTDDKRGWAYGDSSGMYSSGVLHTEDGGRSWSATPCNERISWQAGDLSGERGGIVVSPDGRLAVAQAAGVKFTSLSGTDARRIRQLALAGREGWLVGGNGLLMRSADGGLSWHRPGGGLVAESGRLFDFSAVATFMNHVWVAGSPGSVVYHSADRGESWTTHRTRHNLPLRQLKFIDEYRGWAVGCMGSIFATRDGGQTWRQQRSGGSRAAMLGIFSEARRVPWEWLSKWAAGAGYLTAVDVICRRDMETPQLETVPIDRRLHEAVVEVGGAAVSVDWRFPLRQAGIDLDASEILKGWDAVDQERKIHQLEESLVARIRLWRPDVIVTEAASPRGDQPLSHLINQLVLKAATQAADAAAYPNQLAKAGLETWSVKKVFSVVGSEQPGSCDLATVELLPPFGRSIADHAELGRSLINKDFEPSPATMGFRLMVNELSQTASQGDLFTGIGLAPGGGARRRSIIASQGDLQTLHRVAQKRRNTRKLISRVNQRGQAAWLAQVDDLVQGLGADSAGEVLYQLARQYQQSGQLDMAAVVDQLLIQRHPEHVLSESAVSWLLQYYSSGEAAWRSRRASSVQTQRVELQPQQAMTPDRGVLGDPRLAGRPLANTQLASSPVASFLPATFPPTAATQPLTSRPALGAPVNEAPVNEAPVNGAQENGASEFGLAGLNSEASFKGQDRDARRDKALMLAKWIQQTRPALFSEPFVRFPMAVAHRQPGLSRKADGYFNALAGQQPGSAWGLCARGELWWDSSRHSSQPSQQPAKTPARCGVATSKPFLDGKLNDAVWKQAAPLELSSALHDDADWPAVAYLAYDAEYLYLAFRSRKAPGVSYETSGETRSRDADLRQHDRIALLLDVDRDYCTYYQFSVDARGFTGDACLGDRTWNPQWFVAAAQDRDYWSTEAAIPWTELAPDPPRRGDAWAVGVQRIVPGVGFQAWSAPSAVEVRPEGFGLLLFQ